MLGVSADDKHCLCASGAEVAEPAQHATELARRRGLQARAIGGRPCSLLGPSALAGRQLAAAKAGLRKASELFKHSCPLYTHTTSRQGTRVGKGLTIKYERGKAGAR